VVSAVAALFRTEEIIGRILSAFFAGWADLIVEALFILHNL
jgi:hypothetical protein